MRRTTASLTALVTATVLGLSPFGPATGADHGDKLGEAADTMLVRLDVPIELGAVDVHSISGVEAVQTNALLCVSNRPHLGRKGKRYYESEILLEGISDAIRLRQRVYVYEHIEFARNGFEMIVQRSRNCDGSWKNTNLENPGKEFRVVMDTGRTLVRAEGKRGVWIAGNFELAAAATTWAEDWYTVHLRAGHTIQVFTYTVDPATFGVALPQRRALNKLAQRLANRWLNRLGKNWH